MSTLNLADALIQGYAYNEMVGSDDPDGKIMSGGYPIQSLVNNHSYTMQRGGTAVNQKGYELHLENKAVPIGLVYQAADDQHPLHYVGGYAQFDVDAPVIPNQLYDKLVNAVSVPFPKRTGGTRKHKQ